MVKQVEWYEVFDITSKEVHDGFEQERVLLGRYSTEWNGLARMEKWAREKGIDSEKNIYVRKDFIPWHDPEEGSSFSCRFEKVTVIGIFYDLCDRQVSYDENWAYATYTLMVKEKIQLDTDI